MAGISLVSAALTGIIGSADGPTSILSSGSLPTGYIIAAVVVVILAIFLIRRARQSDGEEPAQADAFGYTDGPTSVLIAPNSTAAEDEELIAVLAAAILMMEQSSGGQKLVIRDIKYMGTEGSPWAAAGRRDLMSQR